MRRVLSCLSTFGHTRAKKNNALLAPVFGLAIRVTTPRPVFASSLFDRPLTVFMDSENWNAHCSLVNDPTYSKTVISHDDRRDLPTVTEDHFRNLIAKDFRSRTVENVCDDFLKVTAYATSSDFALVDVMFDGLRERLTTVLPIMTDSQLMTVLKLVSLWNTKDVNDPKFKSFWLQLDAQCIERHQNWSTDKLLLFMDHWYIMNLSRFSNFILSGVNKLASTPYR